MQVEQLQFKIDGMDCAEEVAVLKQELGPIVGGEDRLSFDLLNAKLTISTGAVAVTSEIVLIAVARTGMQAEVWRDGPKPTDKQSFFQRRGRTLLTAVSGIFTVAGFITHAAPAGSIQQEYSFVAERGYVQPEVYREYGGILKTHLHRQGFASPEAGTRSMLHNSVVY